MTGKRQQLLATIDHPRRVKIYRSKFRPFASTKYLDVRALRKVGRATVEIGTLEVPGLSFPVAAEIRKGMITSLKPLPCTGAKVPRVSPANLKKILPEVAQRLEAVKPRPVLPIPLVISRSRGVNLTIGPIVIVIDEAAPCIWIWFRGRFCLICTFGWTCG